MDIHEFARRFDGAKPKGNGYRVICPTHDDTSPSLDIDPGNDGRVLLCCRAGCDTKDILRAVGLDYQDLYPDSLKEKKGVALLHSCTSQPQKPQRGTRVQKGTMHTLHSDVHSSPKSFKEVEAYSYYDAEGVLSCESVRKEDGNGKKTFSIRRPDGKGGYIYNLGSVEPPPYRLPECLAAVRAGKVIFIVEGEKDADRLAGLGLEATTNLGGAGKWRDSYSSYFEGADVVVLPDNDDPGRKHAEAVAESLSDVARSVRVVNLTGLPPKGDVSDWMDAGNSVEDLLALAGATPPYQADDGFKRADLDIDLAGHIPAEVHALLPAGLREGAGYFSTPHEKDTFILGALTVIASALPNVRSQSNDAPGYVSPDLYFAGVAPAGSGKGALGWSRRLGAEVQSQIVEASRAEADYHAEQKDKEEPPPPSKTFFIEANSSKAAMMQSLEANGGRGLIFASEIDTLASTLGQDWGAFTDVLRAGFHHEPIGSSRKGDGLIDIRFPRISMALTGTPDQMVRLFGDGGIENGLYSRFLVYIFKPKDIWNRRKPDHRSRKLVVYGQRKAEDVAEIYSLLEGRGEDNPLWVRLQDSHWDGIDDTFSEMLYRIDPAGIQPALKANVKRGALIAQRVAMTLAVLRAYEAEKPLDTISEVWTTDDDMEAALYIACLGVDHAMRLAQALPQTSRVTLNGKTETFYNALPATFTSVQAKKAMTSMGMSPRSAYNYLDKLLEAGRVRKVRENQWEKS